MAIPSFLGVAWLGEFLGFRANLPGESSETVVLRRARGTRVHEMPGQTGAPAKGRLKIGGLEPRGRKAPTHSKNQNFRWTLARDFLKTCVTFGVKNLLEMAGCGRLPSQAENWTLRGPMNTERCFSLSQRGEQNTQTV